MAEKIVSKKMSITGWDLKKWILGNWKSVKELIKVGLPLSIAWAQTNDPALVGLITLLGKFVLDLGEYYIKEYKE